MIYFLKCKLFTISTLDMYTYICQKNMKKRNNFNAELLKTLCSVYSIICMFTSNENTVNFSDTLLFQKPAMMDWTARDLTSQWPLRLCRGSCVEQRRSRENQVQPLDEGGDRTAPHRQTEEPRATRARVLLHQHNHRLAMVARWFVF